MQHVELCHPLLDELPGVVLALGPEVEPIGRVAVRQSSRVAGFHAQGVHDLLGHQYRNSANTPKWSDGKIPSTGSAPTREARTTWPAPPSRGKPTNT